MNEIFAIPRPRLVILEKCEINVFSYELIRYFELNGHIITTEFDDERIALKPCGSIVINGEDECFLCQIERKPEKLQELNGTFV